MSAPIPLPPSGSSPGAGSATGPLAPHHFDPDLFDAVARARGGDAAVAVLRRGQLSRRMLLTVAVRRALPADAGLEEPYRRLSEMHRGDPDRWQRTMLYPYLDEGLARALAEHTQGRRPDLTWFGELVRGGPAALSGPHILSTECDGVVLRVRLDDRGPFRAVHGHPPAGPQTPVEVRRWQRSLDGAWQILVRRHPWHARAVAACLSTLVPLRPAPGGTSVSSAARRAYGSVALSPPGDPVLLALTLVHEFLHVQLGALLDLVPLHAPPSPARYHAPWRPDSRPLDALFQGTYAHLGVCDFWHTEQSAAQPDPRAEQEHTTWSGHTRDAIETLLGSGELLPPGRRFTEEMRRALVRSTVTVTRGLRRP
ncbi:HEXXH motif-containing putative peptide modification protein [Streptomyces sp. NBC_01390]|uniref:aKG-HExxH-type peptide beta-hydroxylase n=1 Tax=Streptomyces sp. NBC_01390 TaxID=2903850 RepID=UPI003252B78A